MLLGLLVLALSVGAFAAAFALANGVARRLRASTLELADVRLPAIVRRLGTGEQIVTPRPSATFYHHGSGHESNKWPKFE